MRKFLAYTILSIVGLGVASLWLYGNYCIYVWNKAGIDASTHQMVFACLTVLADVGLFFEVVGWAGNVLTEEEKTKQEIPVSNLHRIEHNPFNRE